MSVLFRLVRSQGIKNKLPLIAQSKVKVNTSVQRFVSLTSKYNNKPDEEVEVSLKRKWHYYGFHSESKKLDRFLMHISHFCWVTFGVVAVMLLYGYSPDLHSKDWALREGYLQLRYREENGLPLVDPNLVDPSNFTLPTEEEIGDTKIII